MAEAWGGNKCDSLASIQYASRSTTNVHLRTCAWLDATTHAPIWWTDHQRRSFYIASVTAYHVDSTDVSSNQQIWSWVARDDAYGKQDSSICGSAYETMVRIEGSRGGVWEPSLLESRRTRQHTYETQWEKISFRDAVKVQPMVALVVADARKSSERLAGVGSALATAPKPVVIAISQQLEALPVLAAVVLLLQVWSPEPPAGGVSVVTSSAQAVRHGDVTRPNHTGSWGFSRVARSEAPLLGARCADVCSPHSEGLSARDVTSLQSAALCLGVFESEVAQREGALLSPRLMTAKQAKHAVPTSHRCTGSRLLRATSRMMDVDALYNGFSAVGLQYGPGYRTLVQAWAGTSTALGRLHARSTHEGTQVHPADLDDALCMSAAIAASGGEGETRLPFAVDGALLQGASGQLWAV